MRPLTNLRSPAFAGLLLAISAPLCAQADWTTFFGRGGDDMLSTVQTDALGRVYVCGRTDSATHVTANCYQPNVAGGFDAYVACLDPRLPAGQQLVWSTHIGGAQGDEQACGLCVDPTGTRVAVVGFTTSGDLPVPGGWQTRYGGGARDGFVAVFDPTATGAAQLVWASYLGGSGADVAVSVDEWAGMVTIAGTTESTDFPTHSPLQPANAGGRDLFVCRLLPNGSPLFSTYLGGSADDGQEAFNGGVQGPRTVYLATDPAGQVIVACNTWSTDFPNPNARIHGRLGGRDLAVSRFDFSGATLTYSALLGGSLDEGCDGIRMDTADTVVIAGTTQSSDFPFTANALQSAPVSYDGLVVHLDLAQDRIRYASCLGGSDQDFVLSAYREPSGTFVLAGHSLSSTMPLSAGAPQTQRLTPSGTAQIYLARLQVGTTQSTLQYLTWFGGSTAQIVLGVATDGAGGVVIGGQTISTDFPVTPNAFDPTFDGVREGWIAVHRMLPAGVDRFGTATSPCGAPTWLQTSSAPLAPNPGFAIETHGAPAGAVGVLMLGAPLPGGVAVFNAAAFVAPPIVPGPPMLADAAGFASLALPLPPGFVWSGQLAMQSFWLNPGSCAGGPLTASNALR